jgi:hypothetical protein
MDFVNKNNRYFKYPQRKAELYNLQRANKLKELTLKAYAKTRWLSLGESLTRIIEIWEALVLYMKNKLPVIQNENEPKSEFGDIDEEIIYNEDDNEDTEDAGEEIDTQIKKFNFDQMYNWLTDQEFYLQIRFVNFIVNTINQFNQKFQNHSMSIGQVKAGITHCYNLLLSYIMPAENLEFNVEKFIKINWLSQKKQEEYFYDSAGFIEYLSDELSPEDFQGLKELPEASQNNFYKNSVKFMAKILRLFPKYFNFTDKVLELTTFLELKDSFSRAKDKITDFGKRCNLLKEEELPQLHSEIVQLFSDPNLKSYKDSAQGNTLKLWDMIDEKEFSLLHRLVKVAHSLPTTSSTIEQAFSILKLYKNEKRNQLHEKTVEALMMIDQEYKIKGSFTITEQMLESLIEIRKSLNERKSNSKEKKSKDVDKENESNMLIEKESSEKTEVTDIATNKVQPEIVDNPPRRRYKPLQVDSSPSQDENIACKRNLATRLEEESEKDLESDEPVLRKGVKTEAASDQNKV